MTNCKQDSPLVYLFKVLFLQLFLCKFQLTVIVNMIYKSTNYNIIVDINVADGGLFTGRLQVSTEYPTLTAYLNGTAQ